MNNPKTFIEDDFSKAWAKAVLELKNDGWNAWDYVVTIKKPEYLNLGFVDEMMTFASEKGLITPDKVQHTIFPSRLYKNDRIKNREKFYKAYNKFYNYTRSMPHSGWGTYFKRMIDYKTKEGVSYDQIGSIIDHINTREKTYGSSHFVFIPQIGSDSNRLMGAPCLNYLTVQVENVDSQKHVSLLAVYRNHDFVERAFGNYWGLCELLKYICTETDSVAEQVTCISSHAYISKHSKELYTMAESILEV